MSPSKRFENEWINTTPPQVGPAEAESNEAETGEAELITEATERQRWLRTMLSRAAGVYLLLFLVLGLAMSALGVNPLANNGSMPKVLFIFVALALLIALANTLTDLLREQGRNWLKLMPHQTPTGKKSDE